MSSPPASPTGRPQRLVTPTAFSQSTRRSSPPPRRAPSRGLPDRRKLGQRALEPAHRLADPVLVLDARDAAEALAARAEPGPWTDGGPAFPGPPARELLRPD